MVLNIEDMIDDCVQKEQYINTHSVHAQEDEGRSPHVFNKKHRPEAVEVRSTGLCRRFRMDLVLIYKLAVTFLLLSFFVSTVVLVTRIGSLWDLIFRFLRMLFLVLAFGCIIITVWIV